MPGYIYGLVQLIHSQGFAKVTIIHRGAGQFAAHGGRTRGAGRGWAAARLFRLAAPAAGRVPRRYPTIEAALARMQAENPRLSDAQALHLTRRGVRQNEDGTFSWKVDNYVNVWPPIDVTAEEIRYLWSRVTCPPMLVYGTESWASNPVADGRAAHFPNAEVAIVEGAGHWVQHDRLEEFMGILTRFLRRP